MKKVILQKDKFSFTLERIARQLIENHNDFENTCMIGIQDNGSALSDRLFEILKREVKDLKLEYGKLDITFYRDDFRTSAKPLSASKTEIDFLIESKNVILVDDVLYTGRTIQSALSAMQHYGRPNKVELVVMVDRRFNRELPIEADFIGTSIDAVNDAYVGVEWEDSHGEDKVMLYASKQ